MRRRPLLAKPRNVAENDVQPTGGPGILALNRYDRSPSMEIIYIFRGRRIVFYRR